MTETTAVLDATFSGSLTDSLRPIQIVVLQRGWVVVGRTEQVGDIITIDDASVVRFWGTTKGLGQLTDGPTAKTVLDKAGTVRAHVLSVVLVVDVDEAAWADKL